MSLEAELRSVDDPALLAKTLDSAFHSGGNGFQPIDAGTSKELPVSFEDFTAFIVNARGTDKKNRGQVLVKSQFLDQQPAVREKSATRKLTVSEQETVFVVSDSHDVCQLPPGEYHWNKVDGGWKGSVSSGEQALAVLNVTHSNVIVCRVITRRPKIRICLPSYDSFYAERIDGRPSELYETDVQACALMGTEASRKEATDQILKQWTSVVHSTGLRTLDNFPVGITFEADLEIVSPKVIASLFLEQCAQRASGLSGTDTPPNSVQNSTTPSWPTLRQLQQLIIGIQKTPGAVGPELTTRVLLEDIRSEILFALQAGIRQETADRLMSKPLLEQKRLASLLRDNESLTKTLSERYGIVLRDVKSMHFFVPMSSVAQKNVADLSARRSKLEHAKAELATEAEELEVQTRKFAVQLEQQQKRSQEVVRMHTDSVVQRFQQKGEIVRASERLESARLEQQLARDERAAEFERKQRLSDAQVEHEVKKLQIEAAAEEERKRVELQKAKMEAAVQLNLRYEEGMAKIRQEEQDSENKRQLERLEKEFELQMRTNAAVMDQRLKFLKQYAGLAREVDDTKLLVMALTANPELAGCYVAAVNARGKDEIIQKMDQFRTQLVATHGQESQLVHQLWTEGVKQIGHVLGRMTNRDQG